MPIIGIEASAGMKPTTPTIGTASDGGTGTTVSVAFTPSTYIGKGTITYTATSSPGSFTGTGSGSPITVSGLSAGTAYTFTVAGTTNYGVLSDSSAASNSVTPATPSSFESIATATGTGSSTITFSSIPQTYKHLQLRLWLQTNGTTATAFLRCNGATGNVYSYHSLSGNGSTVSAAGTATTNSMIIFDIQDNATASGNVYIVDIHDYTSTSNNKTIRNFGGIDLNGSGKIALTSGLYQSTSAITSLTFDASSTGGGFGGTAKISLYGIKG